MVITCEIIEIKERDIDEVLKRLDEFGADVYNIEHIENGVWYDRSICNKAQISFYVPNDRMPNLLNNLDDIDVLLM